MSREVITMARGRPAKCPYCGGSSINKGFRKTKTMGKRRIKLCKTCRRKFTPKNQKTIETGGEPDAAAELDGVAERGETDQPDPAVTEPSNNSKPLLNALDREWTS